MKRLRSIILLVIIILGIAVFFWIGYRGGVAEDNTQYDLYCDGSHVALIDHKNCNLAGCYALVVDSGQGIQFGLDQCYVIEAPEGMG